MAFHFTGHTINTSYFVSVYSLLKNVNFILIFINIIIIIVYIHINLIFDAF